MVSDLLNKTALDMLSWNLAGAWNLLGWAYGGDCLVVVPFGAWKLAAVWVVVLLPVVAAL